MANEVFFDTSGFFALIDEHDRLHQDAVKWIRQLIYLRISASICGWIYPFVFKTAKVISFPDGHDRGD